MTKENSKYHSGPKLLDQLSEFMITRNYSARTIQSYSSWVIRFVRFHDLKHPAEMGSKEVNEFLTGLAVTRKISPSTQNQALNAIIFMGHWCRKFGTVQFNRRITH